MNAKDFLKAKGEVTQPRVRFLNAGAPTMLPLDELLEEYAAQAAERPASPKATPVKKGTQKTPKAKKEGA